MIIVSAIAFALILGAFVFAVLPRGGRWQRAGAVVMFVTLLAVVYAGSIEMLSRPKPLRLEWRNPAKATVLGASIREGKAIYVWLETADSAEPRAYALPWNTRIAEQLQTAMRQAHADGRPVEAAHPLTPAISGAAEDPGKPKFYPQPQLPSPPKDYHSHAAAMLPQQHSGSAPSP